MLLYLDQLHFRFARTMKAEVPYKGVTNNNELLRRQIHAYILDRDVKGILASLAQQSE